MIRRGLVAVLPLVLVAACGSGSGDSRAQTVRSDDTDVSFTGCDKVNCAGELDGAKYEIQLPEKWNGTLLLFSHGYRAAQPSPPDLAPVNTDAQSAPTDEVASALLSEGYALAGSAYKSNGWAVADGVAAGEQLRDYFVKNVGTPARTYVWGESLGGLITQTLAEKHPEWVDGAAPMCGVLGGTNLNFDLALDVAFAVKTLIYPAFKITGYSSYQEALANFDGAYKAVLAATKDVKDGIPKLLLVAALADAPTKTLDYDGSTTTSAVSAAVESLVTGLVFGTTVRQEIEQRVGGNPSTNEKAQYPARVSAAERGLIEAVAPGSTDKNLAALASAPKVTADAAARGKFAGHTAADPLVLVQNETVFGGKVRRSTAKTADLAQFYTVAPAKYAKPAPYGAGHCNFTTDELTGTVAALDGWVRHGTYPLGPVVTEDFGADTGLDLTYTPGPWPAGN
jgi:pimeloyl-ACP methyl ester carboxylesterase